MINEEFELVEIDDEESLEFHTIEVFSDLDALANWLWNKGAVCTIEENRFATEDLQNVYAIIDVVTE